MTLNVAFRIASGPMTSDWHARVRPCAICCEWFSAVNGDLTRPLVRPQRVGNEPENYFGWARGLGETT